MGTTLQDVIVPELFNPYVVNRTMELSALFNSGIVTNNSEFDTLASQAAPTVNMPFFEDLIGESEQVIEGADLTANKISSNKDVAAIIRRAKMWSATDLSAAIDTVQPSNDVAFHTYQGKRVIVDDGCPADKGVYTTYLFGDGAIALGNGNPVGFVPTEVDRDKKKGSGVDYLINRRTNILHPRGIAFTNANVAKTEGPSRAELKDASNWKPVYEPKQIRIVAFKHKLG